MFQIDRSSMSTEFPPSVALSFIISYHWIDANILTHDNIEHRASNRSRRFPENKSFANTLYIPSNICLSRVSYKPPFIREQNFSKYGFWRGEVLSNPLLDSVSSVRSPWRAPSSFLTCCRVSRWAPLTVSNRFQPLSDASDSDTRFEFSAFPSRRRPGWSLRS